MTFSDVLARGYRDSGGRDKPHRTRTPEITGEHLKHGTGEGPSPSKGRRQQGAGSLPVGRKGAAARSSADTSQVPWRIWVCSRVPSLCGTPPSRAITRTLPTSTQHKDPLLKQHTRPWSPRRRSLRTAKQVMLHCFHLLKVQLKESTE